MLPGVSDGVRPCLRVGHRIWEAVAEDTRDAT